MFMRWLPDPDRTLLHSACSTEVIGPPWVVALQHGRARQDLRHGNRIDRSRWLPSVLTVAARHGWREMGPRYIFRPRHAGAGWLSSGSAGTHPATDVAPTLSGCLMASEPKVCHDRFWEVVRAWSMITGDVQIVDI